MSEHFRITASQKQIDEYERKNSVPSESSLSLFEDTVTATDSSFHTLNSLNQSNWFLGIWWSSVDWGLNGWISRSIVPKSWVQLGIIKVIYFQNFMNINFYRSSHPEVFCKKGVLRNFPKFTGKHLRQSLFFNKVAGLRPATLLKKRLWHRCFHVNFAKFLRTPFFIEHICKLLLIFYIQNKKFNHNYTGVFLT